MHKKFKSALWVTIVLATTSFGFAQGNNSFIGIWVMDEGFQVTELLFRSDGRYQLDTRSTDPTWEFGFSEKGRYTATSQSLTLTPYEFLGEAQPKSFSVTLSGDSLELLRDDFGFTETYVYKPGSREDVLARQNVTRDLVGSWTTHIQFYGAVEYTFRPGGYYHVISTPEGFPPEIVRGRYEITGSNLSLTPYSGIEDIRELDFFGDTLTLIRNDATSGGSDTYQHLPNSRATVQAKAAEAAAFLSSENWLVGTWEVDDATHTVDLTFRPDGYYIANETTEFLTGLVRGRYSLQAGQIQLFPFVGQGIYARSNGEFGKVERTRTLDYYDGELQFIDLNAISQSVTIARKRPASTDPVLQKVAAAQEQRARPDWLVGIWEVNDPAGWMEFTFRPDGRYIAKSGTEGIPGEVERGHYLLAPGKLTLAPYSGLGSARAFEYDLYDGDLFLIGDLLRMVVARKLPGSDAEVIARTVDPSALKGERGSVLGLWTAHLPGSSSELTFRPDGEFRIKRCSSGVISHDYGLYTANMSTHSILSDSRFIPVETLGMDFYGDTLTLHGGLSAPRTFTVNLGTVDAAIAASHAADAIEAQVDAQWLARILISPRNPNSVHTPTGDIPADPNPGHVFTAPTVFTGYQLYRRLIPGFVYFNHQGSIKSVAIVNTREWHFFPTGRVLARFKTHFPGAWPDTIEDVTTTWGAYRLEPKPIQRDILHIYADNVVRIETDSGEQAEMTLEDGRRHLFWEKDYLIQWEWASEQQPAPCQLPPDPNPSLMNTGISLSTNLEPDPIGTPEPITVHLARSVDGQFTLTGTNSRAATLVIEGTPSLTSPTTWQPLQTNTIPAGPFQLQLPQGTGNSAYFRVRTE